MRRAPFILRAHPPSKRPFVPKKYPQPKKEKDTPSWGAFEPVGTMNITPIKFGEDLPHASERSYTAQESAMMSHFSENLVEAQVKSHLDSLKRIAEDRAGTRILRDHLPEITDKKRIEIPGEESEESYFAKNPWAIHTSFPYYRQFLAKDLPSRSKGRKVLPNGANSDSKASKPRYAWNTWSLIPKNKDRYNRAVRAQSSQREYHKNESIYRDEFPTFIKQSHSGACQFPVSLYTRNRLQPDGITVIRDFITDAEEKNIISEIMSTTLHSTNERTKPTNYIPEDGRYCTNYFDKELRIPDRGTLAWSTADLPALKEVFWRAYRLKLIPFMPNTYQVNEYVTEFAGFKKHKKPESLGPYIGILSLVSADVLRLYHDNYPWAPRIYMEPRSLVILQRDARFSYSMATLRESRPKFRKSAKGFRDSMTRTHLNFVNFTKDYRIDVMFAQVDDQGHKALDIGSKITALAEKSLEKS